MKKLFSSVFCWLNSVESVARVNVGALAFALSFSAGISADDTDLFFSSEGVPPNILFVLDDSGSMRSGGRMDDLKVAMSSLLEKLSGVNAGIVRFHGNVEFTAPIASVDSVDHKGILEAAVDALEPRGGGELSGTSTQAALWTGRSYFRDELEGKDSPITHECQENHIILMSDGRPTANKNIGAEVETELGITCTTKDINGDDMDRGEYCGAEIGRELFESDHSSLAGLNNVITHTIGLDFTGNWLPSVSGNKLQADGTYSGGFGSHYDVTSSEDLLEAFSLIIDSASTSFAAPTVSLNSFNESRHRDELYFAQFQSRGSVRWNGNIKKYKLDEVTDDATGETETVIVDADSVPLISEGGEANPTSRSLWSATPDGGSIPEGGFAHKLPPYYERQWYTDYNSSDPVQVTFNDIDLDAKLPPESLGAADDAERNDLVSWALGYDVEGFDTVVAAALTEEDAIANMEVTDATETLEVRRTESIDAADLLELAISTADAAEITRDNATEVANDAIDAGDANAGALSDLANDAIENYNAASDAETDARLVAENAASAVTTAENTLNAAIQNASQTFAAALEANEESHYFVADSLHNSPVLLSYWTASDSADRGEVLFSANNMGVLHAIDPETGVELWSYTPEEHLGNIKKYFDDTETRDHVYGLDGQFTLHTTREQRDGYNTWVDNAWLYMTERRGGNRVYALDVANGLDDRGEDNPFSVMWKITGGTDGTPVYDKNTDGRNDFADLAQTWSTPKMVTVKFNCPDACETKELLMFSGGYNAAEYDEEDLDYAAMTVPTEGHGNAVYFVDPETGELAWSVGNGEDHHSLGLGMRHSVPSTPVPVDIDLDGAIDLLFFVDIGGDVWRVDFDANAEELDTLHLAGGKVAELSPAGQSLRFFNPIDVVVSGTNFSTAYFSLVTGSGMRSSPLYEEPNPNRLYSVIDRWVYEAPYRRDDDGNKFSDYNYVTDTVGDDHTFITASDDVLKNVSDDSTTTSTHYGFFRTFELGEKILQPTLVHRNRIFVNSYVPPSVVGGVNCNNDIGVTRLYITSLLDGENAIPDDPGGEYLLVGEGLLAGGQIIDTGKTDAPFFLIDTNVMTIKELTAPDDSEVFRRFRRTGWVELDEY